MRGARAAFLAGGIALAGLAVGIAAQWPAGCSSKNPEACVSNDWYRPVWFELRENQLGMMNLVRVQGDPDGALI